jgi:hypothetical protein
MASRVVILGSALLVAIGCASLALAADNDLVPGHDYRVVHHNNSAHVSPLDRRELNTWDSNLTIEESNVGTFTSHAHGATRPSTAQEIELFDVTEVGYDHASLVHLAEEDGHAKVTTLVLEPQGR